MRQLDVAFLPAEALALPADVYVVVDVLRATTTIAALFGKGLESLLVVDDIAVARERARAEERVLLGEVGGLRPEGFDYGNSPVEARSAPVAGRGAVLFTTNGTRALCAMAGRGTVIAGAIANSQAVAERILELERGVIVCAGQAGGLRFGQDDFLAAGVIARRVAEGSPDCRLGDAARLAIELSSDPRRLRAGLFESEHGRFAASLGFSDDIAFALEPDTSTAAPIVTAHGAGWALLT